LEKVRFACPRCQTVMQTGSDRVGFDVACPHCSHRFKLISPDGSDRLNSAEQDVLRHASTVGGDPTIAQSVDRADSESDRSGGGFEKAVFADIAFESKKTTGSPACLNEKTAHALPVESPRHTQVGFCCPYCRTTKRPKLKSKVSTVGWVVFTVLLLTTCVLSPIGFLIRDYYRICSQCKITLGGN